MEFSIKKRAEKFLRKQGKKGGKTAAKILAAAVAVVTVAALAMPALTMEKEANCGIEEHTHTPECYEKVLTCTKGTVEKASLECTLHQHTKECYKDKDPKKELICGYADYAVHHHDKNCYIDGKLVCQLKELEEHQHTDDCYKTEKTLVCGKEESEGHTHSDSCYEEKKELTCGKEESEGHQHGDDCYDEEGNLICEKEESEGHQHSDDCYKVTKELTCGKEESEGHKHSDACYETEKVLKCDKPEIILHQHTQECFNENPDKNHKHTDECKNADGVYVCGGLKCDKIDVRKHQHSDDEIVKPDATHEHTDACYEEQLVCGKEEHTHTEDCYNVEKAQTEEEQKDGEAKEEANGEDDDKAETVAMPETFEYEDENVSVVLHVEGDATVMEESENAEAEGEADADQTEDQQDGEPKAAADDTAETGEPEENEEMAALGMTETQDEAEDQQSKETNADDAAADENAENGENAEETEAKETAPVMQVEKLEEGSEQYQEVVNYAEENVSVGEEYSLSVLKFHFYQEGKELDVSNCKINAEVTPKRQMIEPYEAELEETEETDKAADEAENGIVLSVMSGSGKEIAVVGNEFITEKGVQTPTFDVMMTNNEVAVMAGGADNPTYTVQYWANLEMFSTENTLSKSSAKHTTSLSVIDTSGSANGGKAKLPKNNSEKDADSVNTATRKIYIDTDNGHVATTNQLTQIYTDEEFEYIKAPDLRYINKVMANGLNDHYTLAEVWVLKENGDPSKETSWDKYDPKDLKFTNGTVVGKAAHTLQIKDGAVIRLVYDQAKGTKSVDGNFYDYDITDGYHYKDNKGSQKYSAPQNENTMVYGNTDSQGINNISNYPNKTTPRLAFGNANTGTGLSVQQWGNNYPNKANGYGYQYCTFGLVNKLSDNKDDLIFNINAPKSLFGTEKMIGKTKTEGNLNFSRRGDTYTLSSVSGENVAVENLDQFQKLTGKYYTETNLNAPDKTSGYTIWSNEFWPFDKAKWWGTIGHDLKFGKMGDKHSIENNRRFFKDKDKGTADIYFPISDCRKEDHNSYFGMHFDTQFTLTADYCGPLEYLFYGDDDMWVFLDDTLICDIGGVHSSVGEYVDLWDYINKGDTGTHTLRFFYTERGASGSSCFMQFTLPSVGSIPVGRVTDDLRIEKQVVGTTDQEFSFQLDLDGAAENSDVYSYTIYNDKNEEQSSGLIRNRSQQFTLKAGWYLIASHLPSGTTYKVTELDSKGYKPSVSVKQKTAGGTWTEIQSETDSNETGGAVSGETQVKFVNTPSAVLPKTGGTGTMIFTVAGGALILIAAGVYAEQLRRKRQKSL